MVLQPIKPVRVHRPQHKVHHGLRYIDFLVHRRYIIVWYYCSRNINCDRPLHGNRLPVAERLYNRKPIESAWNWYQNLHTSHRTGFGSNFATAMLNAQPKSRTLNWKFSSDKTLVFLCTWERPLSNTNTEYMKSYMGYSTIDFRYVKTSTICSMRHWILSI